MLALTPTAADAIHAILESPGMPESAGVRIAPHVLSDNGAPGAPAASLEIALVEGPAEGDQVVDESGARVFLDESVAPLLDDKILDASVEQQQVNFILGEQGPA
jgi:Fe-S cluster assembly iron-binding protein IscA